MAYKSKTQLKRFISSVREVLDFLVGRGLADEPLLRPYLANKQTNKDANQNLRSESKKQKTEIQSCTSMIQTENSISIARTARTNLVGVAALLLAAVGGAEGQAGVALAADHLLLPVLEGELQQAGLRDDVAAPGAAAEAEHQVQRRLLLDVVVGERAAVLQLLPGEDEPLLVRRDALLVLDLGLDVVDGVAALHLQRDRLPRQRLHEDLHLGRRFGVSIDRRGSWWWWGSCLTAGVPYIGGETRRALYER